MDSQKCYYQITIPACDGDSTGFVLCNCESLETVAEVIKSVLYAELKRPTWIKVTPRVDMD